MRYFKHFLLSFLFIGGVASIAISANPEERIKELAVCYATGADILANSKSEHDRNEGIQYLKRCFTDDAVITYTFPGPEKPVMGPSIPGGPAGFAIFVQNTVKSFEFQLIQHTSFNARVDSEKNTMISSGLGYHWKADGSLVLMPFTFTDEIVFDQMGQPKIKTRFTHVLSTWVAKGFYPPPPTQK